MKLLQIKINLSTAFHPPSDGQLNGNQSLEHISVYTVIMLKIIGFSTSFSKNFHTIIRNILLLKQAHSLVTMVIIQEQYQSLKQKRKSLPSINNTAEKLNQANIL